MFEKLLEKILKDVIGQFTEQIDTNNLSVGIWSGQIQISKVKLNKNLFKKFGLPINVVFSLISQLKIKIPWKSLFENPLIISIDSVFGLCEIDSVKMSDEEKIHSFVNGLRMIITNIGKKVIERVKVEDEKKSGYFDTVQLKMFDNLYLNIKNVHLRFENSIKKFSFGLMLDSVDIHAVDEKNNQIFIDRSKLKQNQKVIRRKFSLSKFRLYWEPYEDNFLREKQLKQRHKYFQNSKKFQQNQKSSLVYLFFIDLEGLIVQNHMSKVPYYNIEVNQQKIELKLKKQIIQQILFLTKDLQENTKEINFGTVYQKQCSQKASIFLKTFCQDYLVQKDSKNQKLTSEKERETIKKNWEQIQQLMTISKQQLEKHVQKIIFKEIGKEKLLKSLDIKQIDIQKILQNKYPSNQKQPTVRIKFISKLPKMLVYLFTFDNKPLFQLNLTQTQIKYTINYKESKFNLSVCQISIQGEENSQILWMKRKIKNSLEVQIYSVQNIPSVDVHLQKINILYDPKIINSIISFFTFNTLDSKLKNEALDKLQIIESNVTCQIKKSKSKGCLKVLLSGIDVIFIHKLHQLMLKTGELYLCHNTCEEKYTVNLNLIKLNLLKNNKQDHNIQIVQPFSLGLNYNLQNHSLSAYISKLDLQIDREIYFFIFQFTKIFSREEKKEMLQKAWIRGELFIRQKNWVKTFGIIHSGKIFLWAWNQDTQYPMLKMRIRKAREMSKGQNLRYIILSDKKNEIKIAFKTPKQYNAWKSQIQKIVEFSQNSQRNSERMYSVNLVQEKEKQPNPQLKFTFLVKEVNFQLKMTQQLSTKICLDEFKYQINSGRRNLVQIEKNAGISELSLRRISVHFGKRQIFKNINIDCSNFIYCRLIDFVQQGENFSQKQVEIQSFHLNFDPVFLIKLKAFLEQQCKQQEQIYIIKSHDTLDKQDEQKVLSRMIIKAKASQICFINKKTMLNFASLSFDSLQVCILNKYYQMQIQGKGENLILKDLTGYPNTIYQIQKGLLSQTKQTKFLCSDQQKNSIEFVYDLILKGSSRYSHKNNQLLTLVFNGFRLNYVNQLFQRIYDYNFVQLIGSLTESQFFQQFYSNQIKSGIKQNQVDFKKFVKQKDQLLKSKAFEKIGKKNLEEFIFHAERFYIKFMVKNSTINMMCENENEGALLKIKQICLENDFRFVPKQLDQKSYDLLTQFMSIQMSEILIVIAQNKKDHLVNQEPISLKITIQMFTKDQQYKYLYGENYLFTSTMNVSMDIEPCKLEIKTQNFTTFRKIMLYNISFDDGLDFLMIYDYMDFVPQMNVSFKLIADVLSLEILYQQEQIILDAGNLSLLYNKTNRKIQTHVQCQYIVVGYALNDCYEQVLTSRKNFGKFQPRKTALKSFLNSNQVEKQNKQSIFMLQLVTNEQSKLQDCFVLIQQVMVIFNEKLILLLKKISISQQELVPYEKVFKSGKTLKTIKPYQKGLKVNANKVLFCCKFPDSKGMILALLFTCHLKNKFESTICTFSHLQGFVSNESQISGQNIENIKKRTILRPTQIKYCQNSEIIQFIIGRIFLKMSVNDIKNLINLQNDLKSKLKEISEQRKSSKILQNNKKSIHARSLDLSQRQIEENNLPQMKKAKHIQFSTIELMIINDLKQNLIPLIYGNLAIEYHNLSSQVKTCFKLDFFNIRNSYWEPLIENTNLLIKLQPFFIVEIEDNIDFSLQNNLRQNQKNQNRFININVSTNFIENFYKTVTNKQINFEKLYHTQEEIGIDQINSWVVVNHIGEDIICRSTDNQSQVYIPSSQSAKITFLSNLQESFNPNNKIQFKKTQIFMNVVIGEKLQIKQLNINELGLKKIFFIYQGLRCTILKNLIVDISKNVRYLTLSSMLEVQNLTDLSIRFYAPIEAKNIFLSPKQSKFIPFNLKSQQINLSGILEDQKRSNSVATLSPQKSIYQKENEEDPAELNLEKISNEGLASINLMFFKVKTRYEKMKRIISFEPLYLIKNYMPETLTIILIDKVKQSLINQYTIEGTNSSTDCGITPIFNEINDTQVSFFLDGYQWTNFENFIGIKRLSFKDYSNIRLDIKLLKINDELKTSQILFYYPLTIKNKTISSIKVHTSNRKKSYTKNLEKDKSQILLSRDIILQVDGRLSQQIYLKNHTQFFLFKNKFNNLKAFSKYFVFKYVEKINQNLAITQFKIFNKYLIHNRTQEDIILRPHPAKTGEIQTISKNEITDLLFFEIESRMSVGSMFQFCPKDSECEWSNPLNLLAIRQSTFFLRSRFDFNKMRHFSLEVRKKLQSCLEIVFSEIVNQDDIPYLLANQCENKQILVKNILGIMEPAKQIYFNWDDPFENCQNLFLEIRQIGRQHKPKKLYTLDIDTKQTSTVIPCRHFLSNLQVQMIIEPTRKKIIFKDQQQKSSDKSVQQTILAKIHLPLRISLINNSITPAIHVLDLSLDFKLQQILKDQTLQVIKLNLGSIQIDNQANHNALYPVVMSTQINLEFYKDKNKTLEIQTSPINLKIQQDFFKSISSLKTFFENLLQNEPLIVHSQIKVKKMDKKQNSQFFISKLILPKIILNLEIQTKNFSIETTVNLEKPQICSFPFKQFPYPVKKIILNILSHLSISPWAFVTSFKKGIQILLTEQSTGRAFQGFFGTLLGAVSNSLSGVLGFIVGYDVQRVDNLIDGIHQGVGIFFREISQIPDFDTSSCGLGSILQGTGKTAVNLVFKPIKGILRMTLKITQGIKKTAQFSFNEQTYNKTRFPIVFYNRQQFFLPYNKEQSKNLTYFKNITGNKFDEIYLVKFFMIPLELDKVDLMLVLGTEFIVLMNLTKQTVIWFVEVAKITKMQILDICKLKIWAIDDERGLADLIKDVPIQKKKSSKVEMSSLEGKEMLLRVNKSRQNSEAEFQVWMMNQAQATEVIEMYMKVKKSSKIEF